jgi:hypothetical protein
LPQAAKTKNHLQRHSLAGVLSTLARRVYELHAVVACGWVQFVDSEPELQ